jgi:hypothetical protein
MSQAGERELVRWRLHAMRAEQTANAKRLRYDVDARGPRCSAGRID